ncbi:hypothetical protein LCGC14_2383350 [marine sediment metagenome]|uniref:Uncharacterized protein n=1 Tax=marine sediment metagenome TaxID=412755 RepID=A0A0F9C0B2_9ZZZZ
MAVYECVRCSQSPPCFLEYENDEEDEEIDNKIPDSCPFGGGASKWRYIAKETEKATHEN